MKIISDKDLLDMGSGLLRCARWIMKHRNKKYKWTRRYYEGKCYAYAYALKAVGIVEFLDLRRVYMPTIFLHDFRKGKRVIGPYNPIFLMDKKFFEKILESEQPHQGPKITEEMRLIFPEIC